MSKIKLPEIKDILQTGLQFGHSSSRWNPKMTKYIFAEKNGIHIVDVVQSRELLGKALEALAKFASEGEIVFVGSKRQIADLMQSEAIRAGAHFMTNRWPGGMFTNFDMVKKSLSRLQSLEKGFEEGVQGRTKYEITQMKSEWTRLNRLYRGIKTLTQFPKAMFVVDPRFERVAVKEAKLVGIPVIALADTNCDPEGLDFIIPGNDDAIKAVEMVVKLAAETVLAANEGKGVVHKLQEYADVDVEIIKPLNSDHTEDVIAAAEDVKPAGSEQMKVRVSAQNLEAATAKADKPKAVRKTATKKSK